MDEDEAMFVDEELADEIDDDLVPADDEEDLGEIMPNEEADAEEELETELEGAEDLADNMISTTQTTETLVSVADIFLSTQPRLTHYEYARLIGTRSAQLENGAITTLEPNSYEGFDVKRIATTELERGRLPLMIRRRFPNGEVVTIDPNQAALPKY